MMSSRLHEPYGLGHTRATIDRIYEIPHLLGHCTETKWDEKTKFILPSKKKRLEKARQ